MKIRLTYFALFIFMMFIAVFGQNDNFAFERGVPELCADCGGCQSGTLSVCICFEKLVFQTADIRAIFALLSDTANVNIVVDPELAIKVSLKLENVSWCQVFSLLLDLYDLRAVRKEGYLYILSESKFWSQKFAEMGNINKVKQLKDTETKLFRIENVAAKDIESAIKSAKSSKGEIVVDNTSNTLIITDITENLDIISAMIESLDVLGRQVNISCQIVQIDKNSLKELGIDWSASQTDNNITVSSTMDQVSGASGGSMGNFTWGIISGAYNFSTKLSAIISEGKGKILDQPHIITMDNNKAEIFSGKQIPINTLDASGNIVTTFYQIGTKLTVTPRIAKDDKIVLDIAVERSGYISGTAGYEITTRTATTQLIVKSGDIVTIGGLITNEQQETEYGVPFLKNIPLLGELFKYKKKTVTSTVITIFISPEILP